MQNEPVITACMCTGEPRSILDEAGMHVLVEGVVVCPHCGRNPFGVAPGKFAADLSGSEGGEL